MKINYTHLQELINTQATIIKADLGIQDMDVDITMHRGTHADANGQYPLGYMNYTKMEQWMTVTDVVDRKVTVYPANIMKLAAHTLTHNELCGIVVEALAHELRHAYQTKSMIGGSTFDFNSYLPYERRPEEVDAREYAHNYVRSTGMPTMATVQRRRQIALNIGATVIGLGISLLLRKKK